MDVYLEVVLQVVDQEGHVVAQPPLHRVRLGGLQVLPLHLQSPAVLQLRLHSPDAQQVPEHNVVPAGPSREQVRLTAGTHGGPQRTTRTTHFSRTAGVKRMCRGHWTL